MKSASAYERVQMFEERCKDCVQTIQGRQAGGRVKPNLRANVIKVYAGPQRSESKCGSLIPPFRLSHLCREL